ncbi:IncF plasmid conjugative transfer protein TraD [Acidisarcina polymorpha]|uniref:IncF plasmid conjugative transfer protein TraD n=1 Tax=Acidisarcina polymorpha TaxID=2211140 RepID=A0A2Z5G5Y8_9BACT|nr:type IV secretion system DNA-binding domain-containing protein [Acidisarcina polymorpha]AXC13966.1 IncF plasmid conjugative transfer protein TraD [Acidisarcina polymorpha]
MASTWGRKETLITPPTVPVYTFTAIGVALMCLCFFAWQRVAFSMSIMQRSYLTEYVRAAAGSAFHQAGEYRLFYLYGATKRQPRLALPFDFEDGQTTLPNGKTVPIQLTALPQAQGYRWFGRGLPKRLQDASLYGWLRLTFFKGESLPHLFLLTYIEAGVLLAIMLWFAVPADIKRLKVLKYGRVLRGPEMMSPREFHRAVMREFWRNPLGEFRAWRASKEGGNQAHLGLGFKTTEMTGLMRIPPGKESQHFQMMGDTGAGKTTLIMQLLRQIRDRGDVAIVYDPASEFVQRFYDKKRGDIILNPLDARCPFWSPAMEIESNQEATTISESLYQPSGGSSNSSNKEFFYRTPAQIFAHLLREGPTPHTLAEWMADETLLQKKVKGTEMAFYIDRKAGPQAAGVLASLGLVAQSLRLLPRKEETTSMWNATDWAKQREGWIFITSKKSQREVLRPLISLWIDILVMRLMEIPKPGQKQVWFVIDELASLQKLPQLHSAMTESRKSKNPLVVGFQGRAQLEDIYGKIAEVMLSQPATKIFMRTTEGKAAEWISDTLGKVEIERLKETHFDGSRAGKNYTIDRQIEPLVMASEISGLEDRRAYLKLGNRIARFDFDYHGLPTMTDAFIPRENADDKLKFDRRTLEPLAPPAAPASAEAQTQPLSVTEPKPEAKEPQVPKRKGGAQHRRAITMSGDGPAEKAKAQTIGQSAPEPSGIAAVASEFLQELQQFRESLEEQGRDVSEDELKAVREEWADIVNRAEEQPEQTTSDPIMLTDLDPYLIPLHDPQHQTHILPPYDDEQFSLSLE